MTLYRLTVIIRVKGCDSMTVQELMKERNLSMYRLAKNSGVPYATVNDICSGKAKLEKCTAETVYKLAVSLDVTVEELLAPCFVQRTSFELFKSNVCHRVKELGDLDFLIQTLEQDEVRSYYKRKWYPECFYTLAMVDYLSRIHNIPLCSQYDDLRRQKLHEPVYPASVLALAAVSMDNATLSRAREESIPEFSRYNIIETEVRDIT